eukprot:8089761-Pyramimonas_sp.AAC.1
MLDCLLEFIVLESAQEHKRRALDELGVLYKSVESQPSDRSGARGYRASPMRLVSSPPETWRRRLADR